MPQCPKCGRQYPSNSIMCPRCKIHFVNTTFQPQQSLQQVQPRQYYPQNQQGNQPQQYNQPLSAQQAQLAMQAKQLELQAQALQLQQQQLNSMARCPKCGSTSLTGQKKGYGIGKGVVGAAVGTAIAGPFGLVGLAAGNMGARKVRITCMRCGHRFKA